MVALATMLVCPTAVLAADARVPGVDMMLLDIGAEELVEEYLMQRQYHSKARQAISSGQLIK